ncbi:(d)CMP kinase [Serinibacter arcticus]|uniref:Cytidylate kinase n=1 Tax=Serinibacter arcticus TaxID=1655435 RepID=A0A4Z1E1R4_9MICO|nr:(d)CMP kinase [Serinibacter arcticus]TGO04592.1 Cytidylate kinase [Serinibacter arcticus]
MSLVIALDGPSGSGKSTVGRHLARVHGLGYLDTGAMFRAAAWYCHHRGIDLDDAAAVVDAVATLPLELDLDPDATGVVVDGVDVTAAIRTTEVTTHVSRVATNLGVRAELKASQRAIIAREGTPQGWSEGRGIVAEGRDITTVIAPDADVRILLVARAEARLARRALELHGSADDGALEATRDQIERRDADDSTVSQFLAAADGVVTLDSSHLSLAETLAAAERIVAEQRGS